MQAKKYQHNIMYLENASRLIGTDFPHLYQYINEYIVVLEMLQNIGMGKIYGIQNSVGKESVFFCSSRYLAEKLDWKLFKTNRVLNTLATLGLIEKVNEKDIPEDLFNTALIQTVNKVHATFKSAHTVIFFTIPKLTTEVLEIANERAHILLEENIPYYNISEKIVEDVFGKKLAKQIFNGKFRKVSSIKKGKKANLSVVNPIEASEPEAPSNTDLYPEEDTEELPF